MFWFFFYSSDVIMPVQKQRARGGRELLMRCAGVFVAVSHLIRCFAFAFCAKSKKVATSSSVHLYLVLFSSATGPTSFASPQWNGRFKVSWHDFLFFCFSVFTTLMLPSHGIRLTVDGKPDVIAIDEIRPAENTVDGNGGWRKPLIVHHNGNYDQMWCHFQT